MYMHFQFKSHQENVWNSGNWIRRVLEYRVNEFKSLKALGISRRNDKIECTRESKIILDTIVLYFLRRSVL